MTTRTPSTATGSAPGRSVRLRRGTLVRARGDGLLQVGGDPSRLTLLPDTSAVRGLLHLLEHGTRIDAGDRPDHSPTGPLVEVLDRAGLLLDPDEHTLLRHARACTRVAIEAVEPWEAMAKGLLDDAGFGQAQRDPAGSAEPDLVLRVRVAGQEAPVRSPQGLAPVLHLDAVDTRVCVGPFVQLSETACEACVDRHRRDEDPWHVGAHPPHAIRSAPGEEPDVDPALVRFALGVAVLDLVAWTEGREPLTWSATRWFDVHQRSEHRRWSPHPECSCVWQGERDWSRQHTTPPGASAPSGVVE